MGYRMTELYYVELHWHHEPDNPEGWVLIAAAVNAADREDAKSRAVAQAAAEIAEAGRSGKIDVIMARPVGEVMCWSIASSLRDVLNGAKAFVSVGSDHPATKRTKVTEGKDKC